MTQYQTKLVGTSHNGWGALAALPAEVAKFQAQRVLIVTDPFLAQSGLADQIKAQLLGCGCEVFINSEVVAEPPLAVGERLVADTKALNCDLVIGLGGGSAIDLAKLVAVLATHEGLVADYLNLSGHKQLSNKGLPTIMIPTTSGTGSEVTNISVLSLASSKDVIAHDYLLADVAIVDPELTVTVPAKVTAATGIDALTHAVEAYVSVNANPITDAFALQAITLISGALRQAVANGADRQARSDMSYGSYLAGVAFFNAGVAGVHALAYPLGGQFHLSHGESNAVLLPYVMDHIRSACADRLRTAYHAMGFEVAALSAEEASVRCVAALRELVRDVGIAQSLQAYGIEAAAIASLTTDALKQTRLLARSPMLLDEAAVTSIYQAAWQGLVD
ncbi:MAG: iron-containing alcohol dehydrogenase [Neisseriaceae bacterium]|nr:iron-containing alcohol dehydrogenase [Neisseriaceae bacterium]